MKPQLTFIGIAIALMVTMCLLGMLRGIIAESAEYRIAYCVTSLYAIPAILIALRLRKRLKQQWGSK